MRVPESEHPTGASNEYNEEFDLGDKDKLGEPRTVVLTSKDQISIVISPLGFDSW